MNGLVVETVTNYLHSVHTDGPRRMAELMRDPWIGEGRGKTEKVDQRPWARILSETRPNTGKFRAKDALPHRHDYKDITVLG